MIAKVLKKVLGLTPEREISKLKSTLEEIDSFEAVLVQKSDEYLRARIAEFKASLQSHIQEESFTKKDLQNALNEILPEVFAIVREASKRTLGMRHFPVQMVGGIVLHQGKISEMRTGEGKTLVATCPAVLNALTGKGVHIVTVNDYLARRDSEWMGRIYNFLGLSVGLISTGQPLEEKINAYKSDILYGTNNELGFDYLRDNMSDSKRQQVRKGQYFAIIDEVDSVLIDEARTPLIISGSPSTSKQEIYLIMHKLAGRMAKGNDKNDTESDYYLEDKSKNVVLTEAGVKNAEKALGVSDLWSIESNLAHHLLQAIKAKEFFKKDTDYVVQINPETGKKEVIIVDEFTGRLMYGRRWSDGLHQAIEAREGVSIQEETLTLASITFQNFFRLYEKLGGMTGTALTEEEEFRSIYNLPVLPIPTNKPNVRKDLNDLVYKDQKQKFYAILDEILRVHSTGRPVLVGTTSIEKSEYLSSMLSTPQESVKLLQFRYERLAKALEKETTSSAKKILASLNKIMDRPVSIEAESVRNVFHSLINETKDETDERLRKAAREALTSTESKTIDSDFVNFFRTFLRSAEIVEEVRKGVNHNVLNAKYHEKEAQIVAQAGRLGAITIATNMAGRGTDIVLGGNAEFLAQQEAKALKLQPNSVEFEAKVNEILQKIKPDLDKEHEEVVSFGGLHIIGTERHESRRIDNQLRGRGGRQGDPGSTRFYLALDDSLMKIFGGERLSNAMEMLKAEDDMALEAKLVNKGIENAQKKVESYNYEIRKRLLEYDDVQNVQRKVIYEQRQRILEGYDLTESFQKMLTEQIEQLVYKYLDPEKPPELWFERIIPDNATEEELKENKFPSNLDLLLDAIKRDYPVLESHPELNPEKFSDVSFVELLENLQEVALAALKAKQNELGDVMRKEAQQYVFLKATDEYWVQHLQSLDALREGIHLRGYGNKQPLIEYRTEALALFDQLINSVRRQAVQWLFHIEVASISEGEVATV